ncbi:MAG: hypothetical protein JWM86_1573 [Thermoleophilia bacterium]|nr:hypothetical protein [Thermoleophilia bacterium]
MDSFAISPAAAAVAGVQAFPTEWISSGVVTPVIASPAATTATAWVPQPAAVAAPAAAQGTGLLEAIANTLLGPSPSDAALAQQQLAQQRQLLAQQAVAQPQVFQPQVEVASPAAPVAMPTVVTLPMVAMSAAPATLAANAPAPAPAAAPAPDPTLSASVGGALAGFASATGRVLSTTAGAGVSRARKVGTELWAGVRSPRAIHVSQVPSRYNAAPAAGNKDCGPASVVMTLKLLGKSIPGAASSASPQRLINRVRQLAGNAANTASTTNLELERALTAAGTTVREIADAGSIRGSVLAGKPVILNGNPRAAGSYGRSFTASQMTPYDGAHWIVVSGYDTKGGTFIINDPLSKVGPVKVSPAQLEAYRGGSMGIEVDG